MSTHQAKKARIYVAGRLAAQVSQALAENPEIELGYEVVPIGDDNLELLRAVDCADAVVEFGKIDAIKYEQFYDNTPFHQRVNSHPRSPKKG